MAALPRSFYARGAAAVAQDLLGKVLVLRLDDGTRRRARITETEAYVGPHDLASHSRAGPTRRNAAMFGPPGRAYVYLIYGMHHCLNVVTGGREGQAVLVRAAEPLDGWDADLRGPGRLARAFGLTRLHDHADLVKGPLRILDGPRPGRVEASARIGVDYAGEWAGRPLRFHDASSRHVSRRPAAGGRQRKARTPPVHEASMLAQQHCEPCNAKTPKVGPDEARRLAKEVPAWRLEGGRLVRDWTFRDFAQALAFANEVGRVAEEEGHHPDLHLTDYKRLRVELQTHAIGGLSRNDFVLAAKVDRLPAPAP